MYSHHCFAADSYNRYRPYHNRALTVIPENDGLFHLEVLLKNNVPKRCLVPMSRLKAKSESGQGRGGAASSPTIDL